MSGRDVDHPSSVGGDEGSPRAEDLYRVPGGPDVSGNPDALRILDDLRVSTENAAEAAAGVLIGEADPARADVWAEDKQDFAFDAVKSFMGELRAEVGPSAAQWFEASFRRSWYERVATLTRAAGLEDAAEECEEQARVISTELEDLLQDADRDGIHRWDDPDDGDGRGPEPEPSSEATPGHHDEAQDALDAFLDAARAQIGDRYRMGAEAGKGDEDPDEWDCSELVEWSARRAGAKMVDGSWKQYEYLDRRGTTMEIDDALRTPGALVFRFSEDPPFTDGRPSISHVAISLGDGRVLEATTSGGGRVRIAEAGERFTHAGTIPEFEGELPSDATVIEGITERVDDLPVPRILDSSEYEHRGNAPDDERLDPWGVSVDDITRARDALRDGHRVSIAPTGRVYVSGDPVGPPMTPQQEQFVEAHLGRLIDKVDLDVDLDSRWSISIEPSGEVTGYGPRGQEYHADPGGTIDDTEWWRLRTYAKDGHDVEIRPDGSFVVGPGAHLDFGGDPIGADLDGDRPLFESWVDTEAWATYQEARERGEALRITGEGGHVVDPPEDANPLHFEITLEEIRAEGELHGAMEEMADRAALAKEESLRAYAEAEDAREAGDWDTYTRRFHEANAALERSHELLAEGRGSNPDLETASSDVVGDLSGVEPTPAMAPTAPAGEEIPIDEEPAVLPATPDDGTTDPGPDLQPDDLSVMEHEADALADDLDPYANFDGPDPGADLDGEIS